MKCLRIFGGESAVQPTSMSPMTAKASTNVAKNDSKSSKKRGNLFLVKILLLDDQEIVQEISTDMKGGEVLELVFKRLNLLETPYFGLRYLDRTGQTHWLDATKKVSKRIKGTPSPCTLYFGVKFYAADPCKLVEEITRYHFFLQVKKDILQGRLPVSFDLAADLGSLAVQSELGDYDPRRHQAGYVSELSLFPGQTAELENKIAELHKGLLGLVPSEAEMKFLEKVKWLDLYGVDLHPVMGEGNVEYYLGLTPSGVLVLKNKCKVGYYFWPRITKVYFQRRYFMVRVKDGGTNGGERTFGFELPTRQACKHLWRCSVEHHAFFRLTGGGNVQQASNWTKTPGTPRLSSKAFSFVSRFRYSGRTQKEAMEDAKRNARTPPPDFPRRVSKRQNYLRQRRIIPGAAGNPSFSDSELACDDKENYRSMNGSIGSASTLPRTFVSVPQPAKSDSNGVMPRSESPLSTRSAPWARSNGQLRGLYSNQSPRSIRSAEMTRRRFHKSDQGLGGRSSSVDSVASNDSARRCRKRHHHHSSRHNSDNESEKSTKSGVSSRHQHFYQNRQRRSAPSGRESESEFSESHAMRRHVRSQHQLNDDLQKGEDSAWERSVVGAPSIVTSGRETESEFEAGTARRHRKNNNRSRSRSPGAAASRARNQLLPEQVRQHLAFDLVDPNEQGMSEEQLKDIPYTRVETNGRPLKIHYSPVAKKVYVKKSNGPPSSLGLPQHSSEEATLSSGGNQAPTGSPPPPYTGPVSSTPVADTSVSFVKSPSVEGDVASSRSSSLRSSSTAQTAILRTPVMSSSMDHGQRMPMTPVSRMPPMNYPMTSMAYATPNGTPASMANSFGSLQRRPKPLAMNNTPGCSATLPRNLNSNKTIQPPTQPQPYPVRHPPGQNPMQWNANGGPTFQQEPYGQRLPMMPQNPNGNMMQRTSTPMMPRPNYQNGPRPMMMPSPPRAPGAMQGKRPPQPCSYELPYRQFQPNHPNLNGMHHGQPMNAMLPPNRPMNGQYPMNGFHQMNGMGGHPQMNGSHHQLNTINSSHHQLNTISNSHHHQLNAMNGSQQQLNSTKIEDQYSPNYQNLPPPPPPPPHPYNNYFQYDNFHNYANSGDYQVPPPNPAPVDPPRIPHYSPVYSHQVITRNQEPISHQPPPQLQQPPQLGIPMSSPSRPGMYTPTRHTSVDHHPGRTPLPQPRNSFYFMPSNDYVNKSQLQGPPRNTPMAATDHSIQRASSQELSTEL